jgi:hypothetical protein
LPAHGDYVAPDAGTAMPRPAADLGGTALAVDVPRSPSFAVRAEAGGRFQVCTLGRSGERRCRQS